MLMHLFIQLHEGELLWISHGLSIHEENGPAHAPRELLHSPRSRSATYACLGILWAVSARLYTVNDISKNHQRSQQLHISTIFSKKKLAHLKYYKIKLHGPATRNETFSIFRSDNGSVWFLSCVISREGQSSQRSSITKRWKFVLMAHLRSLMNLPEIKYTSVYTNVS